MIWDCLSHRGRGSDWLGMAVWYDEWGQWTFESTRGVIWSSDCLTDVADFLRQLNAEAKPK